MMGRILKERQKKGKKIIKESLTARVRNINNGKPASKRDILSTSNMRQEHT